MEELLIVGGGIAGAAAGYFLAGHYPAERRRVVLIEREAAPGYHSTGRSAALFTENYGSRPIRALTRGSRPFFEAPPPGFGEHPLLTPRGVLMVSPRGERDRFAAAFAEGRLSAPGLQEIGAAEARRRVPVLDADWLGDAMFEPAAMDIDVHALHQGFLRGITAHGGRIVADAEARAIRRVGGEWRVETPAGSFAAPVLVNAAGAWADEVARLAGVAPVGLVPKRRTAFTIDPPEGAGAAGGWPADWPMVIDVAESFYFKPEAGRLLVSPADETPVPPCDVQPEEIDIAEAAARLEAATTIRVRRIARKWAGLRSFVADKNPVAGFAPGAEGFFWLAGQGGYGIQTAPSLGRLAAALVAGEGVPADLAALGVEAGALAPERLTGAH
jgi:D-arginine dehydrogenase